MVDEAKKEQETPKVELKGKATQEEKDEEIRVLKKLGSDKFLLVIERPFYKIKHEQLFSKVALKDIYVDVKKTIDGMTANVKGLKKQLKDMNIKPEEEEELKAFMEKFVKASNLRKKDQLVEKIDGLSKEIKKSHRQAVEITAVIPEILRNK